MSDPGCRHIAVDLKLRRCKDCGRGADGVLCDLRKRVRELEAELAVARVPQPDPCAGCGHQSSEHASVGARCRECACQCFEEPATPLDEPR